ncbi:putative oxidoreductase C-terminal domain-containing protein [Lentisphaerota bacterium ZTH]|nr:oxidoreductase [Lentisphaerota bacterium]WET05994.1 putative oxidoreductase C-terminal domain-containing protein [Lentisphaerota bacterium ZTH]
MIINPGHFHAALVLRQPHPAINNDVYIYAEKGPDIENFMQLAESFNSHERGTCWQFHLYTGKDYLEKAIKESKGDIAILAGKNDRKIYEMQKLHNAGISILADKPLTINAEGVKILRNITSGGAVVNDIMTERNEIHSVLKKYLIQSPDVFGKPDVDSGKPVFEKESIHHLYKTVNGRPLIRPAWYFDVNIQGEGILDVNTHFADLIKWSLFDNQIIREDDICLKSARRWPTEVPLEKFKTITGQSNFPASLAADIEQDALNLFANGELTYTIKGIPARLKVEWALEAPAGSGDTHYSAAHGTKADIVINQSPATGGAVKLSIIPRQNSAEFAKALRQTLENFPVKGVKAAKEADRYIIQIPADKCPAHEAHFAMVLDEFLAATDEGGLKKCNASDLVAKYSLLAQAREMALKNT